MRLFPAVLALALWAAGNAMAGIKIRLEGNQGLAKRRLLEVIDPDPEDYTRDGLRSWREDAEFYLLDLYRSYGYFEAAVRADLAPRGEDPEDWTATIAIQEGPRYLFDSVKVTAARLRESEGPRLPSTRDSAAGPTAVLPRAPDSTEAPAAQPPPADSAAERAWSRPADSASASAPTLPAPSGTGAGPAILPAPFDSSAKPPPGSLPSPFNPRRAPSVSVAAAPLGGPGYDTSDLEARPGKPFHQDALLADRRYLLRRYGNAGFVRAEADDRVEVRRATKTVMVEYLLDPGEPVLFDTLEIRNMRAPPYDSLPGLTREDLLRDLVPYSRGDTVRMSGNDKLVEKLQYAGAFNFVRIKDSLRDGADGRSTLYLLTEEHVPGSFRSSVFYETQYGAGVSVDGRHSNVSGTLNEVRTGFSLAGRRQNVYAGYGSPLTLGMLVRFDDDMDFNWYQDQPDVHADEGLFGGDFRWANSARLTWPYSYWLRLVSDAQLEVKSRLVDTVARERDLSLNFIQTAFFTFVDQEMDPTRGIRFSFTWGNGGPLQKGNVFRFAEFRHNWVEARTAHYYPVPGLRMLKLATRLDGGRFFGQGGPNSDRFFLGGSRSVRSFRFQHLCPMDPELEKVCVAQDSSLAYVQASAEVRARPFWYLNPRGKLRHLEPMQLVPFLDYGKVWDVRHPTRFTWTGSRHSGEGYALGLGIRYPLLGIFNLRLDFVLQGQGEKVFWLDLAQAF